MRPDYDDPLPGVPSIESPFFREIFSPSDECFPIARSLNERGFAVINFPDVGFDDMAERLKHDLNDRFPWSDWRERGADMRIQDAWRFNDDVRRVAVNATVAELLSRLYGRRAFPFQTLNFPVGTQQHFHTDSVHFSSRPERFMCGVWVALEDVGADQGPLVYYPGSHRWPIFTREHIGTSFKGGPSHQTVFEPMWERLVAAHRVEPERFFPRRGQALIWAANLLHGGDVHRDRERTRWSQVTHYFFEDCVYYTPLMSDEPLGEIHHRRPLNVMTGSEVDGAYNGEPVPAGYIAATKAEAAQAGTGFDPARYLSLNPDVAAAGVDAWEHYVAHGQFENRAL